MRCASRPMVETKYPRAQSDCFSYRPLTRLIFFLSHAELLPFSICMTYETESRGVASRQRWLWSSCIFNSMISQCFHLQMVSNILLSSPFTFSFARTLPRYFGAHTRWYFRS